MKGGYIGTHRACIKSVINPISLAGFILLQEKLLTTRCVIALMQYCNSGKTSSLTHSLSEASQNFLHKHILFPAQHVLKG